MAIMSEIKCARCDRKYSGVRSRCPYCGARRIGRGKYSDSGDNIKGKMLICVLILAVITVAVGALLLTTPMPAGDIISPGPSTETPTSGVPSEIDNTSIPGPGTPPPATPPTPIPTPEPVVEIESLTITYDGRRREDITLRGINATVPLGVRIEPMGVEFDDDIEWISSNTNVFDVVPTSGGTRVTVRGTGVGQGILTVKVGEVEAECIIRVRAS